LATLKGSTDLGERLDPESLREVMLRYFEAMRAAIEEHGGRVEKYIGDAVNVAARLEQAAPHGALLGDLTYRLVRDCVEAEPLRIAHRLGRLERHVEPGGAPADDEDLGLDR